MHAYAALALVGAALAVPFGQGQHHHHLHDHVKRAMVWHTVTIEEIVTVPVTKTVWLNPGETPPSRQGHHGKSPSRQGHHGKSPSPQGHHEKPEFMAENPNITLIVPTQPANPHPVANPAPNSPKKGLTTASTAATTSIANESFPAYALSGNPSIIIPSSNPSIIIPSSNPSIIIPSDNPTVDIPSTSSSTPDVAPGPPVDVAPTSDVVPTTPYVAPTTPDVAPTTPYVAPTTPDVAPTTPDVAPTTPDVAPTTPDVVPTTPDVVPSPYPTAAAPAPVPSTPSPPSDEGEGGVTGMAAAGTYYTGDLTWYDVGLGSCGLTSSPGDHIVAVSHVIMSAYNGANPNNNPLCGKTVSITGADGQKHTAKIVDTCPGCDTADLDLSLDFFNLVTDHGDGRVGGMKWCFD